MKKPSPRRLALHRDTVKTLRIEQLRQVEGGATNTGDSSGSGTGTVSTGPSYSCKTHVACTIG